MHCSRWWFYYLSLVIGYRYKKDERTMKKIAQLFLVLLIVLAAYLVFWPVDLKPFAWNAPEFKGYVGEYAPNNKLEQFERIDIGNSHGPEAVISGPDGYIYTATHDGWILRFKDGESKAEQYKNVGGRPLGMGFDKQNNLWIANAYLGLQKIDADGNLSLELNQVDGTSIEYADDLVVLPNGKVYFSDASTRFSAKSSTSTLEASKLDLMEHSSNARVIEYDPATKQAKVTMDGLNFANGVSSDAEGNFLLIVETGSYRVWKHWLQGYEAGKSEVIIDNLPGFPDNIHRGQNGRYWVGLTSPRSKLLDKLSNKPFLRKVVQRLPAFLRPKIQYYGHVLAIDENGKMLTSLQDPKGNFPATTGAWETDQYLYVSSLIAPTLARYKKSDLGL